MDGGIYHDFYRARDQIELWWTMAQPHLVSDVAMHAYVALGIIDALACAFVIAYFARLRLADLKVVASGNKLIGRPATRAETVERQLKKRKEKTIVSMVPFIRDFSYC